MVVSENRRAIIWSGLEKVGTYVVNFGIQIILARLLCPDDYAVVAMLAIFFAISQAFIDSGFATTLIQKQDCSQADYCSVFYFNLLVSGLVYLCFFFGAPYLERFYNFPRLTLVTRVYSLNLCINAVSMVHRVRLTKELKFKGIAIINFTSIVVSAIPAVIMAYYGFGYWALITQVLLGSLVSVIMFFIYSRWKPSLIMSLTSLKELAPFGIRMLFVYLFHAVYNNIYSLLIGKRFPAADLGLYDRGKTLASMGPVGFSDFYTRALYPIQAKIQDDENALKESYNRSFSLICYGILPVSVFMAFFSYETVFTLYGEKWVNSAWILAILCIGYLFYPLQALNMNMLKVKGRGDYMLKSEVIKKTLGILTVFILIQFSLKAVVIGWTCCAIVEFLISEFFFWKLYKYKIGTTVRVFLSTAFVLFLLAFAISSISKHLTSNYVFVFFVGGIIYITTYGLFYYKKIRSLLK